MKEDTKSKWQLQRGDGSTASLSLEKFQALKADAGETWAKSHDFH